MLDRSNKQVNDDNIINLLFEVACQSERVAAARIAAAITIRKRVIAVGNNSLKTHPFQKKFSKNDDAICIHAENDAIMKALRVVDVDDLKRATLYIARAKKTEARGKYAFGLAKPCEGCQRAIAAFGIKTVVYTNNEGTYQCL